MRQDICQDTLPFACKSAVGDTGSSAAQAAPAPLPARAAPAAGNGRPPGHRAPRSAKKAPVINSKTARGESRSDAAASAAPRKHRIHRPHRPARRHGPCPGVVVLRPHGNRRCPLELPRQRPGGAGSPGGATTTANFPPSRPRSGRAGPPGTPAGPHGTAAARSGASRGAPAGAAPSLPQLGGGTYRRPGLAARAPAALPRGCPRRPLRGGRHIRYCCRGSTAPGCGGLKKGCGGGGIDPSLPPLGKEERQGDAVPLSAAVRRCPPPALCRRRRAPG